MCRIYAQDEKKIKLSRGVNYTDAGEQFFSTVQEVYFQDILANVKVLCYYDGR